MHAIILGVTFSLIGIEAGWRPLPGGGVEYIIQLHPREADLLLRERGFNSDVPSQLKDVRVCRIVIGTDPLPQIDPPQQSVSGARSPEPFPFGSAAQGRPGKRPWLLGKPAEPPPDTSARPKRESQRTTEKEEMGMSLFEKKPDGDKRGKDGKRAASEDESEPSGGSWWPLTLMLALLGSFGGNVYLGWITWETRSRYRTLLHRRSETEPDAFIDAFPE